jgi:dsDNA-specific endonuclease/ATPase MutS2
MSGQSAGYVLHGHGTNVLKNGLRSWLPKSPLVKKSRPAEAADGGDAFTIVELI